MEGHRSSVGTASFLKSPSPLPETVYALFNLFCPLDLAFLACSGDFERDLGCGKFKNTPEHTGQSIFWGSESQAQIIIPLLNQKKVKSCVSHLWGKLLND